MSRPELLRILVRKGARGFCLQRQKAWAEAAEAAAQAKRPPAGAPAPFGVSNGTVPASTQDSTVHENSESSGTKVGGLFARINKMRLTDLLDAQITEKALQEPTPFTLQQILKSSNDHEALFEVIHRELPIRFALRIKWVEHINGWEKNKYLRNIHRVYTQSFRDLGLSAFVPTDYRKVLGTIKRRHSFVVTNLVAGVRQAKEEGFSEEMANQFLDRFFTCRIGTEMLSSQYLALARPGQVDGIIARECIPMEVIACAAEDAVHICKRSKGGAPPVDIINFGPEHLPFIPQYLHYIMFEILKNSLRAVYDHTQKQGGKLEWGKDDAPITVTISGDENSLAIRLSDQGGGIPEQHMERLFSYLFTTADAMDPDTEADESPMAGFGCGLPLSRAYAKYLGGNLYLESCYGYGTDVYLYLNRTGTATEKVPKGFNLRHETSISAWDVP